MDLFSIQEKYQKIADGAYWIQAFLNGKEPLLLQEILKIEQVSPFRHLQVPNGAYMSVAMTNVGKFGWVSDLKGYRYQMNDPMTGKAWPQIPEKFYNLAQQAAALVGYQDFTPNACLINKYQVGAKMSLHQDKDEGDFSKPIVSFSLGLPVFFQFGGRHRQDTAQKYWLEHGDVLVWGGPSRLNYHGVLPLRAGCHSLCGSYRYNLTFRQVV